MKCYVCANEAVPGSHFCVACVKRGNASRHRDELAYRLVAFGQLVNGAPHVATQAAADLLDALDAYLEARGE